jgi:two-component system chemotaxis response regulator CheB
MKPAKVMIVDDSLLLREALHKELSKDANIHVVAKAADPYEASKQIVELLPDVLIVDVFMDKMNGIDFVKQLLPQYFLPVLMISSKAYMRAEAEKIPTVTFFDKPREGGAKTSEHFYNLLRAGIRAAINRETLDQQKLATVARKLIAIGASTGGAEAIEKILKELPSLMPPILIAQHMPPRFTTTFTDRLNKLSKLSVKEAEDHDPLIPGQVYVAPGGYHMSLKQIGGQLGISCAPNQTENPVCPSVDILFDSVARYADGPNTLGVLLTGMGRDGANGLKAMFDTGCMTLGQDEQSCVVYGMPKAAQDLGAVRQELPAQQMPKAILDFAW